VDQLFPYLPASADPGLATVAARLKKGEDAVYVRNEILKALERARTSPVAAARLADARSNARYAFVRRLDNTDAIASTLARYVRFRRSFDTVNRFYRVYDSLRPEDLTAAANRYVKDERLVETTLAQGSLSADLAQTPALATLAPAPGKGTLKLTLQKSALPQINVKLLFGVGSAHDPAGKEGLATLAAQLLADGGSKALRIDEVKKALFPMAGSFDAQVDKEMTTFTGVIHKDNAQAFLDVVLPMLTDPGLRPEDFQRLKDQQKNALVQDLRNNNEEELGKERLQTNLFAGTPYGHPALGTVEGLEALTLEDVKAFLKRAYTRAGLSVGLSGDVPDAVVTRLEAELGALPEGPALPPPAGVVGRRPRGLEIEIVQKETRATAISFGLPLEVTRSHPDFAALSVARAWLGEHRSTQSHLFQRIREVRGMNYGDYAYIEAFPRGMFQFFPDPNLARRAQLFEVWIRPVAPENAHLALRIGLYEVDKLVKNGLSAEDFEATRNYLMKNVYLQTSTQNQQLGYALDSKWYGTGEFTTFMRERLAKLTREEVNRAVQKHLSAHDLSVVIVTKDAAALRDALVKDAFSPIKYESDKPKALLDEDQVIGALKLDLRPEAVRITPVDDVFKR
jgi:zinc protease